MWVSRELECGRQDDWSVGAKKVGRWALECECKKKLECGCQEGCRVGAKTFGEWAQKGCS